MAVWQLFADDLRLFEARRSRFSSLHDCFVRELKPGARTIDPDEAVLASPCDAVVGEFGDICGGVSTTVNKSSWGRASCDTQLLS